jgi:hypothetical protein
MKSRPSCLQGGRYSVAVIAAVLLGFLAIPGVASTDEGDEIERLKAALAELRDSYDRQIKELEERILVLEEASLSAEPAESEERDALRAAAEEHLGTAPELPTVAPTVARQRSLNRLNPEISATGIVSGVASDVDREEFERGEFELDLQANLDPYSKMRWTIAFSEEGEVDIEEGYLAYSSLPGGLALAAGRFRQRFGALNRQHLHALPQTSYPLVLQTFFGEEGLGQTGVSASWLLPRPWAGANELILEITDGENQVFAGEDFSNLALLGRLTNFWETSASTYVEWGLSGIEGRTEKGNTSRVWGSDLTVHWQPPRRAKYREITWRTELLLAQRDDMTGVATDAWGGYSYLEGLVMRNLYLGARYDWTQDPFGPQAERWAIVPYLTWWQSEWVRLRAEYQHLSDTPSGASENRFTLQLTWAAGPHKHETY